MHVVNDSRGTLLGVHVRLLDNWWTRLRGLLFAPAPTVGHGVILTPCRAVHMYLMRFPLDVVFLDPHGRVVALYPSLTPGARTRVEREAQHALELPEGTIERSGTEIGDRVTWTPAADRSPPRRRVRLWPARTRRTSAPRQRSHS